MTEELDNVSLGLSEYAVILGSEFANTSKASEIDSGYVSSEFFRKSLSISTIHFTFCPYSSNLIMLLKQTFPDASCKYELRMAQIWDGSAFGVITAVLLVADIDWIDWLPK